MSLLLEALKKAEKAKEEAQRRARAEGENSLQLQGEAPAAADPQPVVTRDKLPDISQPLEILTDDVAPQRPAQELRLAAEPRPKAAPQPKVRPREPDPQGTGRATARKVFEAKFREPNPRMPFYITMSVLGVFAFGTVAYFWYQLRPPPALVNTSPPRPAAEQQVAAVQTRPAATVAAMPATQAAIPGLPGTAVKPPPTPAPAALEQPRLSPRLQPALPPRAGWPERATELNVSRPAPLVHPRVEAGYAAYVGGNFAAARGEYQQALQDEPANRDAALGLGAVEVRSGRYEAAEAIYVRLLRSDPRDSHAQAGLIALRGARSDPLVAESRVKSMLAADPGAHVLNFTLGNQFAQQARWAEAQQEYFKAFAAEPDNADFAYNLAVSLDHLRQPKPALEYYRRAVALAKTRGSSFDVKAAEGRAEQLAR